MALLLLLCMYLLHNARERFRGEVTMFRLVALQAPIMQHLTVKLPAWKTLRREEGLCRPSWVPPGQGQVCITYRGFLKHGVRG